MAVRPEETTPMTRLMSCVSALLLLVAVAPAAAQLTTNERDILNREHSGNLSLEERGRLDGIKASQAAQDAKHVAAAAAQRERLLRLPPLPDERNVLLGSWRLEDGGLKGALSGLDRRRAAGGTDAMFRELWATLESNPAKLICGAEIGNGITFASTTYSIQALDGSKYAGSIAYRSTQNQVIFALPANWKDMPFRIEGPNRILFRGECPLVRVGAPATNAAANATTAPGHPRTGAANSSVPTGAGAMPQMAAVAPSPSPSTLARPSPEVCRNTLIDKLGVVGVNQVRAMSDVRFKEAAIEGKVPNTNNLRIDLRGSACDDPRIKAMLYDFDANGMLQSVTYLWDRPPGAAPAAIFQERMATLSRFHALPPPQSPGRLQADTSLGRLILEDLPERNLLLEAYKTSK